jgi:ribose transport system substrate-binding protein
MRCSRVPLLWVATLAPLIVVGTILAGCGKQDQYRYRIAFLLNLDHPYWNNMRLGAVDEGQKLGAKVIVLDAREDPVLQLRQIDEVIAKQVDAVCLAPMKEEPLVNGVKRLNEAGIPVIIVNRQIGPGCDYVCYVGTDTYGGAVVSAKILMKAIGGKGKIVEFHQYPGTGPEIDRSRALRDVLKDYPEVKLVGRFPHNNQPDELSKQLLTVLDNHPDLKGVFVQDDKCAVVAAEVCHEKGRGDVAVVGVGGSREEIQSIREGKETGTSYQRPEEEGRQAIRLAVKALQGEKLQKSYPIECPAITKENADKFEGQF